MAVSNNRQSLQWLAAELLVVVIGILLALQADALREEWSQDREGLAALRLIQGDLRSDSVALASALLSLESEDRAVRRLAQHFSNQEPVSPDSLAVAFRSATLVPVWISSGSAYWGLRDSGRLGLIRDEQLRAGIVDYYDGWSPYLLELMARLQQARDELVRSAILDFVAVPTGPRMEDPFVFELVTPLQGLPSNPELRGQLGYLGRWTWWVGGRLQIAIRRNAEMISSVSGHLGASD